MRKAHWEQVIESKYGLLLTCLVLLVATHPLFSENSLISFLVQSVLSMAIILAMMRILGAGRALFLTCVALAVFAVFCQYQTIEGGESRPAGVMTALSYMLCLGIAVLFMVRKIFSEKSVTGDTVKGGISLYILIGVWWELLYSLIWALDQGSFVQTAPRHGGPDFFYFSFTTITTLGYGDIVPHSQGAKVAAMLEAMVGQVYLAVFVARLVGLHIAGAHRDR
jgi:hypothetical protein